MSLTPLGWRTLSVVAVAAVMVILALGCQQQQQQQPPQPEGQQAASPTAQMPQGMLDALHGKKPEGETGISAPPGMPPAGMPPQGAGAQAGPAMPMGMPKVAREVVVPEAVKNAWKSVTLEVAEAGGAKKDYDVAIHGKLDIPGSGLSVQVVEFLPDFKMTPQGITSATNEPKNPAAKVIVVEGGKQIYKGWLFKLYPEAHPFQHPKYQLSLKGWKAA